MPGIYLHIPFCQTRCVYCDFFSSTSVKDKESYVDALCEELHDRKDYLQGQPIETIYFGGGTPSQLSAQELERLFEAMLPLEAGQKGRKAKGEGRKEITLEANPEDITQAYVESIRHLPFNRISLGIQSFNDEELKFLNRRHNAETAIKAVRLLQKNGFENISIDLIYGLPGQTLEIWENNLQQALALSVQHISAYHLTYEEGTPLFRLLKQGAIRPVEEEVSVQFFETLIVRLTDAGFEHYEISNFARPGFRSKHNAAYWSGAHYLGVGASAHSYNGVSRQWNPREQGAGYRAKGVEIEWIDDKTAYNDFIITRLRTMDGMNLNELASLFGKEKKDYCLKQAQKFIENQLLELTTDCLRLTRKGIFVSDGIMSELMD